MSELLSKSKSTNPLTERRIDQGVSEAAARAARAARAGIPVPKSNNAGMSRNVSAQSAKGMAAQNTVISRNATPGGVPRKEHIRSDGSEHGRPSARPSAVHTAPKQKLPIGMPVPKSHRAISGYAYQAQPVPSSAHSAAASASFAKPQTVAATVAAVGSDTVRIPRVRTKQTANASSAHAAGRVRNPVSTSVLRKSIKNHQAAIASLRPETVKAVKISAKAMRFIVTAAILICVCTGIISAVFVLGPGTNQLDPQAFIGNTSESYNASENSDETVGKNDAETLAATYLKSDAAEAAVSDNGRYNVEFTFYKKDSISCTTTSRTVGELVDMLGINLTDDEKSRTDLTASINEDTVISVDSVSYGTDTSTEAIAYETEYVDVQNIPRGSTVVKQEGKNGVRTYEYSVTYVNGVETERSVSNEYVSTSPTNRILYRGVGGTVSIGGKAYNYSYYLDCDSTVYTVYSGYGMTASGAPVSESGMATDPRVIPMGTTCYVEGSYYSGIRTATDTGSSIKGNIVDLFFYTDSPYFYGYGRRNVRVYVLG